MTTKTRYFVVASLLVLTVGLGTGLVAYYVEFQGGPGQGPDELQYLPATASLVAFADVQAVMVSEVRRKLLDMLPSKGQGQQEFEAQTGINVQTDIDHIVACAISPRSGGSTLPAPSGPPVSGLVLARGRFNNTKIEALLRDRGASATDYKGKRLLVGDASGARGPAVAFLEPGLVGVGSQDALREAIDVRSGSEANVTSNAQIMDFIKSLNGNAWAVGRFDALTARANLPPAVASQIPPITWFSASVRINGGVDGALRADARDEESANSLRDVVRGVVALARLQTGAHPELKSMIDSIQLGGTGNTVTLSFDVTPQIFDLLATTIQGFGTSRRPH